MQVRGKLFPYPVLNNNLALSNYANKTFDLLFEDKSDDNNLYLQNVGYYCNSASINKLIEGGKIGVLLIVESANVIYRKKIDITNGKIDFEISNQELSGKIEISMYAYSKESFTYIADEVDSDYKDLSFEIEKYDIIAINDGISRTILHKDSEENLVKSIFSIQPLSSIEDGMFDVQYENSRKILISMSDHDHGNYNIVYSMPTYQEVFFNMILIPSLTQALSKCFFEVQRGADLDDIILNFQWFASIQKQYKRLTNNELNRENFLSIPPIQLAQMVLGKPIKLSLEKLIESTKTTKMEEE